MHSLLLIPQPVALYLFSLSRSDDPRDGRGGHPCEGDEGGGGGAGGSGGGDDGGCDAAVAEDGEGTHAGEVEGGEGGVESTGCGGSMCAGMSNLWHGKPIHRHCY